MRITLGQVAADSRIQQVLGNCAGDLPRLASYLNEAIQRLINTAGEEGFWGGWAKVAFTVSQSDPYLTLPSQFARAINIDVCRAPIRINNEWYEFLENGIGLQSPCPNNRFGCAMMEGYERGMVSTAFDLTTTNQYLRVYITDARDAGKRVLFAGAKDQNGNGIYQTDVQHEVIGLMLEMTAPFVTSSMIVTAFSAISKDETYGDVVIKQVDATTGVESLLSRLGPSEMNPVYRRYYLRGLPTNCCATGTPNTVQVSAMCKYEFQPVSRPTDFLLIGNVPALKKECQSIRHDEIDSSESKALSISEHREAVKMLSQELHHYSGNNQIAVDVAPWGTARLERQSIGSLI